MLKKIAPDKWKHFFVGIGMGAVLQFFFLYALKVSLLPSIFLSVGIAAAISYGFELYSLLSGRGHYEIMDAVASVIGGMVGISLIALI
jgi:glycopeptide antibiotics resistance protein